MTSELSRMTDAITPWAIRVVATLRVADRLADGPLPVGELAGQVGADQDALLRVLRYLVHFGLFTESAAGTFGLTPLGEGLRDDHPSGRRGWLDLDGVAGRIDLAFTGLLHTVRTGRPAYPEVHGRPFWTDLAQNEHLAASFDALMAGHASWFAQVATAYDWSGTRTVVDVGGGTGELLIALLEEVSHLKGTVVDVPATAKAARDHIAKAGLAERCEVVEGDFFDALPPGADRYLLSNVLHDWDDENAIAILRRCAEAAGPNGAVLLVEELADEEATGLDIARMDLRMFVLTGGKERSAAEFGTLAAEVGLRTGTVTPTPSGHTIIELRPDE
nr:O-methyltransferase [Actinoallomurus sp.]